MIETHKLKLQIELVSTMLFQLLNTVHIYWWLNAISYIKNISSRKKYRRKQYCFRALWLGFILTVMAVEVFEMLYIHIAFITNPIINFVILFLYFVVGILLLKNLKKSYSIYLKERKWIIYITTIVTISIIFRIADTFIFEYW